MNELLDDASTQIAEQVNTELTLPADSLAPVAFSLACNLVNATVELDGAAIGTIGTTPGRFSAMPGLHRMRISREGYATWDKDVNIFSNQTLSVQLEFSEVGFQRFRNLSQFKADLEKEYQEMALRGLVTTSQVAIAKVQSDATAYAKMRISEGWKTCLEHSWIHDTGERSRLEKEVNVFMGR